MSLTHPKPFNPITIKRKEMENVIENNKLIAEFMGLHPNKHDEGRTFAKQIFHDENGDQWAHEWIYPKYDTDWNQLMPVVEKIARIPFEEEENTAHARTFGMLNEDGKIMVRLNRFQLHIADTLIESTYGAVLEYINWYNDNQNPPPNESN